MGAKCCQQKKRDELYSTVSKSDLAVDVGNGIYGETDSFEAATWKAAQVDDSGTIFSQGNPPEKVSGFNLMTKQLKERLQLQQAMGGAREVQQNLLPQNGFIAEGLEVAGKTLYCDATGGDYIDLLEPSIENRHVTVVVGDVVGHGIGAALLMASLRALIRGRASRPSTLAQNSH